jgi:dTDP-4-dehydrorhamnose reductase
MKIVIIGSGGRLGAALMDAYRDTFQTIGFDRANLDLTQRGEIHCKLDNLDFDVLINAAALTNVDLCESDRNRAFLVNGDAPRVIAEICDAKGAKLIHLGTDYIFDGQKRTPYTEEDEANPLSVYGESKLLGDKNVVAGGQQHLVVRISWVFGPRRPSFIDTMIKRAQQDEKIDAVADKFSTPTFTHDIAGMLPQFFDRAVEGGILHFANAGKCSWQEYAQWALDCCRDAGIPLKARTVGAVRLKDMANWVARRPVYSVLSAAKYTELTGTAPRAWREAVADYITRFYSKK